VRDKISNRSAIAIDRQRMNEMQPTISVVIARSQRVEANAPTGNDGAGDADPI
jgi:hypothetical protein